jgi:hypothetical protein
MDKENQPTHIHQILANGQVIYTGDDWRQAFLDAARNPDNGTIVHTVDGEPGVMMGPTVRLYGSVCPFMPPMQSVYMQHPAFIRGYKDGLACATEPQARERITDKEFVSLLKMIFEEEQAAPTEEGLYYGVGNLIGLLDAQQSVCRAVPWLSS